MRRRGPAEQPFSTNVAVMPSPWSPGRKLVRIGIKGYAVQPATRPRANLVFLIDTSGSMEEPNKLPLVKQSLAHAARRAAARRHGLDRHLCRVRRARRSSRRAARDKAKIEAVIDSLGAGGSTAGAEGIRQAYELAEANLDPHGVNRVILATDGDFNVGITNQEELKGYIEREREKGVFLSVLGFGMGNYNDALMQTLAQNGNGAAAYIDTLDEARKVLVEEASSTLFPIAKDVKIQVEFNPAAVAEYRLIGYETRALNREDFNNDKVDAGDVGAGHTVTALYEIVPVGGPRTMGDLRYSAPAKVAVFGRRIWLREDPLQAAEVEHEQADRDADHARARVSRASRRRRRMRASRRRWQGSPSCFAAASTAGSLSYDDVIQIASRRARQGRVRLPLGVRADGSRGEERADARQPGRVRVGPPARGRRAGGPPNTSTQRRLPLFIRDMGEAR